VADELVFDDLEPVEVPVTIGKRKYVLREASEGAAVKFRNVSMRGARMDTESKVVTLGEVAEAEPVLVAACLCPVDGTGKVRYDPGGNPITCTLQQVLAMRPSTVKALFAKVKEISPGLEEPGAVAATTPANGQAAAGPVPGSDPTSRPSPGATATTSGSPAS